MLRQLLLSPDRSRGLRAPAVIRQIAAPGDGPAFCRALCARQAALEPGDPCCRRERPTGLAARRPLSDTARGRDRALPAPIHVTKETVQ